MPRPRRSRSGRLDLASLGIVLVPDVLDRTPPFVDRVRAGLARGEGRAFAPTI